MTIKGFIEKARPFYYKAKFSSKIKIGKQCRFRKGIDFNINDNGKLVIGNNVFINNNCSFNSHKLIQIGDDVLLGENVHIYDHNHIFKDKTLSIRKQGFRTSSVKIGTGCWIGSNVTILAGVSIGEGCIIGANCLINSDILANSVVRNIMNLKIEERR